MNVPLTPMTAIEALRQITATRAELITNVKARYAEIDAEAKQKKEDLRTRHKEANRDLVAAVRQAQTFGIHVEDSAKIIGMSPQALYRLEQETRKWEASQNSNQHKEAP